MSVLNIKKRCNYYFEEISKIPRGTKNELEISNYVENFALERNLQVIHEPCNNVIIYKSASSGYENHEPLILQGHMDMVCEKNRNVQHDFKKDPLDLYIENGYLKAKGTTLGADDGVAVAYMLAILEDDTLKHPPLECIFTIGEEEGLDGAFSLNPEHVHSKRMIGLDNTQEGYSYVSSAGGVDIHIEKEMDLISNTWNTYSLDITGLMGGHSAVCIQLGRANAIQLAGRILYAFLQKNIDIQLVHIEGGLKFNAIPRECFVTFSTNTKQSEIQKIVDEEYSAFKEEYKFTEDKMRIVLHQVETSSSCFDLHTSKECILLIFLMKNGCIERMQDTENMPFLSISLGVLQTIDYKIVFTLLARSPLKSNRSFLANQCKELSNLLHANCVISNDYDGWNYDANSKIRSQLKQYYKRKTGKEYLDEHVHGGLEIGIFKGKIPELDAVTFGPNIYDYHTPDEALDIASFERCYDMLVELLEEL